MRLIGKHCSCRRAQGQHPNSPRQSGRYAGLLQSKPPTPHRSRVSFPNSPSCWCAARMAVRQLYSLVHNREHANVSWILGESERFAPEEDSLTVRAGVLGAYPNMFFVVPEAEIEAFSSAIARLKSAADYERLVDSFGVRRSNEKFWLIYDEINSSHLASDPGSHRALWISRVMRSRRIRPCTHKSDSVSAAQSMSAFLRKRPNCCIAAK